MSTAEVKNKIYAALTHLFYGESNEAEELLLEVYNLIQLGGLQ